VLPASACTLQSLLSWRLVLCKLRRLLPTYHFTKSTRGPHQSHMNQKNLPNTQPLHPTSNTLPPTPQHHTPLPNTPSLNTPSTTPQPPSLIPLLNPPTPLHPPTPPLPTPKGFHLDRPELPPPRDAPAAAPALRIRQGILGLGLPLLWRGGPQSRGAAAGGGLDRVHV